MLVIISITDATQFTQIDKTIASVLAGSYRPPVIVLDSTGNYQNSRVEVYQTACVVADCDAYNWCVRQYRDDLMFVRAGVVLGKRTLSKLLDTTAELVSVSVPDTWGAFLVRPTLFDRVGYFDPACGLVDFGWRAGMARSHQFVLPLVEVSHEVNTSAVKLAWLDKWGTLPTDFDNAVRVPFSVREFTEPLVGCLQSSYGQRVQLLATGRVGAGKDLNRQFWSARENLLLFFNGRECTQACRRVDGEWWYNLEVLEDTSGIDITE